MSVKDLNDSLDGIFAAPSGPVRVDPVRAPADYQPKTFEDKCPKCKGSGRFVSYSGRTVGNCFHCKGAGKLTFKTDKDTRIAKTAARLAKVIKNADSNWTDFVAEHSEVATWLLARPDFDFARSLVDAVRKYGDLTPNQFASVCRLIDKDKAKDAERAARVEAAPVIDTAGVDRLKAAFDVAIRNSQAKGKGLTLRNPKITVGGVTISPAKATSSNPGALYVKVRGGDYLGKIASGKFFAARACDPATEKKILAFVADPEAAAKAYGQETGVCCICNATLKSSWRLRGIGPVCATKFGWDGD